MPSRTSHAMPAEREQFRRWLLKLSGSLEAALADRDNSEAATEVRAMILSAIATVGSMDRRAKLTEERRTRQLEQALRRFKSSA